MIRHLTPLTLLLCPLALQAESLVELSGGSGQWQASFNGQVGDQGQTIALEELGYDKEPSNMFWLRLEHEIPLLPNIKLLSTSISASSTARIQRDFFLAGILFKLSSDVQSQVDLSHIDATLYYELLDGWFDFDSGISIRQFSGHLEAQSEVNEPTVGEVEGVIPMLYVRSLIDLPVPGWQLGGNVNYAEYDGEGSVDYQAQLGYHLDLVVGDLGVNFGYRNLSLKVKDFDGFFADAEISGFYAEFQLNF